MEAIFLAAIQSGISEEAFWGLTPYQTAIRVKAVRRAEADAQLLTGWFAERFAREEKLQGPQHYIDTMLRPADPALEEAEALAKFNRMAEDWGLVVEDVG